MKTHNQTWWAPILASTQQLMAQILYSCYIVANLKVKMEIHFEHTL
jgi:hypothetical protein